MNMNTVALVESRLAPIFARRGGYKEGAAHAVALLLVMAQEWGAGNALAGSLLMRMPRDAVLARWRAIVGDADAELPCRMSSGTSAYLLLDQPTGDAEMDLILLELAYGSACGTAAGFGSAVAARYASERLAERTPRAD
jgi:hypothetical protein